MTAFVSDSEIPFWFGSGEWLEELPKFQDSRIQNTFVHQMYYPLSFF